ncbi:hypothetical protein, partial [Caldisericum sp.]|uniref:hypothetical protein n=1 Tax=Caldisericum sp. TaxID=2499687 RepID=UPI003D0A1494
MGKNPRKETQTKKFIALKGGEEFMRKFINIVVALTMLLSLVAPFRVQTASAFPGTKVVLTTSNFSSPYRYSQLSRCSEPPSNSNPYWVLNKFSVFD